MLLCKVRTSQFECLTPRLLYMIQQSIQNRWLLVPDDLPAAPSWTHVMDFRCLDAAGFPSTIFQGVQNRLRALNS